MASVMKKQFNVKPGDRVAIYMPMVPEAAMAMLACARIGAIHCVIFGGFAAEELASRLDNSGASLLITGTKGIEPSRHIDYIEIVEKALKITKNVDSSMPKFYLN